MGEIAPALHPVPGRRPANDLEQFRAGSKQVILWPAEYKTGNMIYPYGEARKK